MSGFSNTQTPKTPSKQKPIKQKGIFYMSPYGYETDSPQSKVSAASVTTTPEQLTENTRALQPKPAIYKSPAKVAFVNAPNLPWVGAREKPSFKRNLFGTASEAKAETTKTTAAAACDDLELSFNELTFGHASSYGAESLPDASPDNTVTVPTEHGNFKFSKQYMKR